MVSHPETGSDSPIGSDRDRGRDNDTAPTAASAEDTIAMVVFIPKIKLFLEGLKLTL